LVRDEIELARPTADQNGLSLSVDTDDVWVNGQADLLREAVQNLVDNAIKYTEDGNIRLSVVTEEGRAVVRCRDTGMGIAAEELPHVSARFYRSADAGSADSDGSGLGLALVRRIVAAHDGELRVDSTPGEGTTFEIVLPSIAPPNEETERVASPEASHAPVRP
jgi:signal transduction histidine kinase